MRLECLGKSRQSWSVYFETDVDDSRPGLQMKISARQSSFERFFAEKSMLQRTWGTERVERTGKVRRRLLAAPPPIGRPCPAREASGAQYRRGDRCRGEGPSGFEIEKSLAWTRRLRRGERKICLWVFRLAKHGRLKRADFLHSQVAGDDEVVFLSR